MTTSTEHAHPPAHHAKALVIPIRVVGNSEARLEIAFFGTLRKRIVITAPNGQEVAVLYNCLRDAPSSFRISNFELDAVTYKMALEFFTSECGEPGSVTTELHEIRRASGADAFVPTFSITRSLYGIDPDGHDPNQAGITIIMQEGMGPIPHQPGC